MTNIVHDETPITMIYFEENDRVAVGVNGITKIEPYWENGQMAATPWFRVYIGDKCISRFNGAYVKEVCY